MDEGTQLILARLDELEGKINRALGMELGDAKRGKAMSKAQEEFNKKLEEVSRKVDQSLTERGNEVKEAVAAAVAAHQAEDDEAFKEATKKLDEIGDRLIEDKPDEDGNFTPSGM
jgi:hypothetical protein